MPRSEQGKRNATKYRNEYAKKNYKRIPLNVSFDLYDRLKSKCDSLGVPVNTYIKQLLENDLSE